MRWFKLFTEARNDAKLRALTSDQFRVWFNLLCFAAEQSKLGRIEFASDEILAVEVAGGDVNMLNETVKRLETLHCVSSGVSPVSSGVSLRFIAFHNFEKRQHETVSGVSCNTRPSTERVRKCRDKKRLQQSETVKRDETPSETHETLVKRSSRVRTGELDLELELRTSTNAGASVSIPFHPPRKPTPGPGHDSAVKQALESFGDDVANRVVREWAEIEKMIGGRWDFLAGAFVKLAADLKRPNAKTIDNPLGAAIFWAKKWADAGSMPSLPIPAVPPARKPEPVPGYMQPLPVTDEMRAAMERKYEIGRRRVMEQNAAKAAATGTGG